MASYVTYLNIPHDTYSNWKTATLNNSYIVDNTKELCWNYVSELWYNVGFPTGYPLMGISDYPAEIWILEKDANASYNGTEYFNLIYTKEEIKEGDVLVFSGVGSSHIGIANEDYSSTKPNAISLLSEGLRGNQNVTIEDYPLPYFIGGFRYIEWNTTPPTPPTPTHSRKRFPWVLYANRLRNKY